MDTQAKHYDPSKVEDKWYAYWLQHKFFHSEPDKRPAYTIVIPPPNVTGILHMGHVLNNTLNDVLIRKARMDGKNACWVPGTDHASIATESKVVAKLKAEGISKEDLTREEFLKHAWEWKEKHGGIILSQLRKLGASCDWDRTKFTMDPDLSEAVINTFVYFYKKGYIYKGVRMVNWDPEGLTAVSDEEVIHRDTPSKFYHMRYFISDGKGNATDKYIIVATTRPETIMADAAVCINPADERYHWLKGKKVLIPLINKEIPIIEDSYVEMDFGTGCLKVTPAHDVNDYEIGLRHHLPVIDIIDDHGRLTADAQILVGEDRFVARKKIAKMLEEAGNLEKTVDYTSPIGYSERTNAVIEPKLSAQWFLKMDALAKDALESVESGKVKLIPDKYRNTYKHWMENVRDWCISRQLWWGQRIPAWYLPDGRYVVENDAQAALKAAQALEPSVKAEDLHQDEDVLDTWFSSWLWPISVFDTQKPRQGGQRRPAILLSDQRPRDRTGHPLLLGGPYDYGRQRVYARRTLPQRLSHRHRPRQTGPQNEQDPRQLPRPPRTDREIRGRLRPSGNAALLFGRQRHPLRRGDDRAGTQLLRENLERLPPHQGLGIRPGQNAARSRLHRHPMV